MEIIDAHAHIYPTKIAEKATAAIGDFYGIKMSMPSGVPERLLEIGKKAGISRFVVHSCATKAVQVRSINEFIKAEIDEHKEFLGYMTLHQDMTEEEMRSEVEWCCRNGFKGVKLHPDFQKFYIDDENVEKIYRAVGDIFPILFHTGDDRYEFSKPYRLANVAKKYKNVRFIAAHFGGYRCWDEVDCYKGLDNVYFDTSSSLPFITVEKAKSLIDEFGADRFFFGSDFPMWNASEELERFMKIPLTEKEREKILAKNLKSLLKLD
ncbi:MAG: amidohydrolase family protein [Clostridia bacterium]|nr:amidohydrolase family protein [Clostridia bacterium]